jgi:4-hydroxy-tetrahydrodipicolinate synthase
MFMPFSHPYLSNAGARDYYRQVIDAVRCPTLVYKKSPIPGDDLLLELAGDPHVVGIKYAENNLHDFRKVVLADRGRVEWLCGSAERFAPFYMLAGAPGYTTGAGNVCPHLTLAMHTAFAAGEYGEGMRWQKQILPIEDFRAKEGDSFIQQPDGALKVVIGHHRASHLHQEQGDKPGFIETAIDSQRFFKQRFRIGKFGDGGMDDA